VRNHDEQDEQEEEDMVDEHSVASRDGTTIAFEQSGTGPPLILVAAALSDRKDARKLAALLAPHYTVVNYDRRGRGASGDTSPYAVERECEDIEALVKECGGTAFLFGSSSGSVLALEAAARGIGVEKVAVFEPPFVVDERDRRPPADLADHVGRLIAADRRAEAVTYFMTEGIGMPAAFVWAMRLMPRTWSSMKAMAPTIPYDVEIMGDTQWGHPLPAQRWHSVLAPTLVLSGGKSPEGLRRAAAALAGVLPDSEHRILDGVSHAALVTAPKKLVPVLRAFFDDEGERTEGKHDDDRRHA
jgi:pimeloyl-ACP methyl ester carboxylesterase